MKVVKSSIPRDSLTREYLPADHTDVFSCVAESSKQISPDDIMVNFWATPPKWVNALFKLRNFLIKLIGLKSSEKNDLGKLEASIRSGESYGIASVPAKNENETVLLLTDSHLSAYMSVHIERGEKKEVISIITLVHFKNKLGRFYFLFIAPFHNIIVKTMLKSAIKAHCLN